MKIYKIFIVLFAFVSCAQEMAVQPNSLLEAQPRVLSIQPETSAALNDPIKWTVTFSERIDIQRWSENSAFLSRGNFESNLENNWTQLKKKLEDPDAEKVKLRFIFNGDQREVTIEPEESLDFGKYQLIMTPNIFSVQGIPFNQTPGKSPTPFIAQYTYGNSPEGSEQESQISENSFGPAPDELMIHEFLYDGLISETDGESFVELYGTPNADVSLYQILFVNGADGKTTDQITLPLQSLLGSNGLFVVADLRTNSSTETKVTNANFVDQFDPQNGPDSVLLLDREGNLVDVLGYGEGMISQSTDGFPMWNGVPAQDVAGGHSLSRQHGMNTQENASDFIDLTTPSPGEL